MKEKIIVKLKPTQKEKKELRKYLGCYRFIYNLFIIENRIHKQVYGKYLTDKESYELLQHHKQTYKWLNNYDNSLLTQPIKAIINTVDENTKPEDLKLIRKNNKIKEYIFLNNRQKTRIFLNNDKLKLPSLSPLTTQKQAPIRNISEVLIIQYPNEEYLAHLIL